MNRVSYLSSLKYAGKNWHELADDEKAIVAELEKEGFIIQNTPNNGFVGRSACIQDSEDTHL